MFTTTPGRSSPDRTGQPDRPDWPDRLDRPRRLRRAADRTALALLATTLSAVVVLAVGEAAWAQAPEDPGVESIPEVVDRMRLWLIGILFSVAVFFFTLGGFRYMWSNGDPGELEKAKTAFRNAGIGLALAILAPLLVTIVVGFVS